jgi:hypothetical protein
LSSSPTVDPDFSFRFTVYNEADLMDFINAPVGKGLPITQTLRPLIAVPTTAGTGSETTGTAILDITSRSFKTGIANRALKPVLGIVVCCGSHIIIIISRCTVFRTHTIRNRAPPLSTSVQVLTCYSTAWKVIPQSHILNVPLGQLTQFFDQHTKGAIPWLTSSLYGL